MTFYAVVVIVLFVSAAYTGGVIDDLKNIVTGNIVKNEVPSVFSTTPKHASIVHSREIVFKWNYGDGNGDDQEKYVINVDETLNFRSPEVIIGSGSDEFRKYIIPGAENDRRFYWRVVVYDGKEWSEWSKTRYFIYTEANECGDGTDYGSCSVNKPQYCDQLGRLIDDCETCGCAEGLACEGGSCVGDVSVCGDGTVLDSCSLTKSLFCNSNAKLIERCDLCDCGDGEVCEANECVLEPLVLEPQRKGILIIIWNFFKGLFS